MSDAQEAKRPKYDSSVLAKDLLVGLKEELKDHAEWVAEGREHFEASIKNGKATYGEIRIVAWKSLHVMANIYTRDVFVELKNTRPVFKDGPKKGAFTLRLSLAEFEGLQKQLRWIEAFTLKVVAGFSSVAHDQSLRYFPKSISRWPVVTSVSTQSPTASPRRVTTTSDSRRRSLTSSVSS
jgi:hypothetical protein